MFYNFHRVFYRSEVLYCPVQKYKDCETFDSKDCKKYF